MKSYFIGAGMGLVLAALLMGYSARHGEEDMMQQESVPAPNDVQQEAMTEAGEEQLEDLQTETEDTQEDDLQTETEDAQEDDVQAEAEDIQAEAEDQLSEEASIEQEISTGELRGFNEEEISLEVKSGDTSLSVSRRLVDAGVIADASLFDQYLCEEGYARTIRVGSYVVPTKATWEDIALLITN